jgi:hypothetical protein
MPEAVVECLQIFTVCASSSRRFQESGRRQARARLPEQLVGWFIAQQVLHTFTLPPPIVPSHSFDSMAACRPPALPVNPDEDEEWQSSPRKQGNQATSHRKQGNGDHRGLETTR